MRIEFTVPGRPQGKDRPRASLQGGRVHTYTTNRTRVYEDEVRKGYLEATKDKFFGDEISVAIIAFFSIPKTAKKADREQMTKGAMYPRIKPDSDNIAKVVCDALNGVAYDDDKQIVDLSVYKRYTVNEAHVQVIIEDK